MAEYLKEFIDGEVIEASEHNANNNYLLDQIRDSSSALNTKMNTLNSNISSEMATLRSDIEAKITESDKGIANIFSENGLYITTYINGNTWYKEYFSDKEKTTRVWLEQGGYMNFGNAQFATRTITFPIAFTAICNAMGILFSPGGADDSNQGVAGWSNTTLTYVHRGWGSGVVWRAVGK